MKMQKKSPDGPRILAVVVTYYPDSVQLIELLEVLADQVATVFVIDNTDAINDMVFQSVCCIGLPFDKIRFVRLGSNRGIAAALNVGLDVAMAESFDFVLLSDQDSLPRLGMVNGLYRAYEELMVAGSNIGAVGPTVSDLYTGVTYSFQAALPGHFFYGHIEATRESPHVMALTLITSGILIPVEVIGNVGPMREDFFVDHVDIEWCHRARGAGYQLFGTGWAVLYQRMGDARLPIWFFGWRYESAYSPVRIYYRVRNFLALCGLKFVDPRWKFRNALYWVKVCLAHVVFGSRRLETIEMIGKGIWDGLIKRMGPYKER